MTVFLGEIVAIYPAFTAETLTVCFRFLATLTSQPAASRRVCPVLSLLQCVASHEETRHAFLAAQFPQYFYPFLTSSARTEPYEFLRLASLGVIATLVKVGMTVL